MSFTRETYKVILKIAIFSVLDAMALWASLTLYSHHAYKLLVILLVGTVLLNIVFLSRKAYPLRYIIPGTLFMLCLVVYPLLYTAYISFTNYGTGHILNKEQSIEQITGRYYLPEGARTFKYSAYADENREKFILLLKDSEGNLFLARDDKMEPVSLADKSLVDKDADGEIDEVYGYTRLSRKEIFRNLSALQKLEYEYHENIVKMKNFALFAELRKQYKYFPAEDKIVDLKTGKEYFARHGYFVAEDGENLLPGFMIKLGWENYKTLLTDDRVSKPFIRVFIWTFEFALLSVLTTFALGLFLAILLNDPRLRFRTLYRTILILPYAIPGFISILVWRGLFDTEVGVINEILQFIFGSGLPWLQDAFWAKFAILVVNLWLGYPYMMLICLGALQSIPGELYEAAAIDGASGWQRFKFITLPMLLVSVAPLLISSFAYNFNNFLIIYLFNRGRPPIPGAQTPAGATDILISYTYRLSFESGQGSDFGLASAVTILIFIITAVITWFNFRYTGALEDVKENV